jgi:hypothetical protein
VTGQKITDLDLDGAHAGTHAYMGGTIIAEQFSNDLRFKVNDPVTGSMRKTSTAGVVYEDLDEGGRTEIVGLDTAVPPVSANGPMPPPLYNEGGWVGGPEKSCVDEDGSPLSCNHASFLNGSRWRKRIGGGPSASYSWSTGLSPNGDNIPFSIQEIINSSDAWGLSAENGGPTPQTAGKARFIERDQKQYDKKRVEVRKRLDEILNGKIKKCLNFLRKASLSVQDILNAVNLQRAYDGDMSEISMSDAGNYDRDSLSQMEPWRRDQHLNQRVKEFLKPGAYKAITMLYAAGVETNSVMDTVQLRSDVYFRIGLSKGVFGVGAGYTDSSGLNQTTILHEALHSLTGLDDSDLFKLLTGKTEPAIIASAGISQALMDNDCTK